MNDSEEENKDEDLICPHCGLRSYNRACPSCQTPLVINEEENEERDWRERK